MTTRTEPSIIGVEASASSAPAGFDAGSIARSYVEAFRAVLDRLDLAAVERLVSELRAARDAGRTVYICGNGGSAATASHWVNDLSKATKRSGRVGVRAMCLSDNTSWLTALANDEGYDRVFAGQLENFAGPGDVLILISASGNSPNLLRAVEVARERGLLIAAFVGFDGGRLKDLVDVPVWVPTDKGAYGLVETAHVLLCDIVTESLIADRPVPESA
jgi:D-sedoheptulose 7-phosphate isomerase